MLQSTRVSEKVQEISLSPKKTKPTSQLNLIRTATQSNFGLGWRKAVSCISYLTLWHWGCACRLQLMRGLVASHPALREKKGEKKEKKKGKKLKKKRKKKEKKKKKEGIVSVLIAAAIAMLQKMTFLRFTAGEGVGSGCWAHSPQLPASTWPSRLLGLIR